MILPERNMDSASRAGSRPRHRGLIIFIAFLILVLSGYAAWWFLLVEKTRAHIDNWIEDVRAVGHGVSYDKMQISGFPSQIALEVEDFEFTHVNGEWRITIPNTKAHGVPWQLDRIDGHVVMPISVEHTNEQYRESYSVSSATNSFNVTTSEAEAFAFELGELEVTGSNIKEPVILQNLTGELRSGDANVFLRTSLKAAGVKLPKVDLSPFGEEISSLELAVDVDVHPSPASTLTEQLDIWRRAGGAIEVRRLSVKHGVLGLSGDGTITLDRHLQPEGAFGVTVSGFNPAVDALVEQGLVPEAEGQLAKAALGLFAKVPPGGGRKTIDVPLTVQDRQLSVGPFPLMRIPRVYWDE